MRWPKRQPLTAEQRDLAGDPRCVARAHHQAEWFSRGFPYLEDEFLSAAMQSIVFAASTYDPSRGRSFSAYVNAWIDRSYSEVLRAEGRRLKPGHTVSLSDMTRIEEILSPGSAVEAAVEFQDTLDKICTYLTEKQSEIIRILYGDESRFSIPDASQLLGIVPAWGWELHKIAIETLRARSTELGLRA